MEFIATREDSIQLGLEFVAISEDLVQQVLGCSTIFDSVIHLMGPQVCHNV